MTAAHGLVSALNTFCVASEEALTTANKTLFLEWGVNLDAAFAPYRVVYNAGGYEDRYVCLRGWSTALTEHVGQLGSDGSSTKLPDVSVNCTARLTV